MNLYKLGKLIADYENEFDEKLSEIDHIYKGRNNVKWSELEEKFYELENIHSRMIGVMDVIEIYESPEHEIQEEMQSMEIKFWSRIKRNREMVQNFLNNISLKCK